MSSALVPQVRGDPYIRLKQLGQGSFGRVLLVRDSRDGQLYVLKEVDLQQFGAKGKKEALKEVAFLNQLSHPYIIKYVEYFEKQGGGTSMPLLQNSNDPSSKFDTGNKPMLFIVMEHANGGDLDAKIKQQRKLGQPFTEKQILEYFCQIVLALKHIHDRKILHRDVKSENIFLSIPTPGAPARLLLGDFGISKHLASTMAQAQTRIGTPYYLSPEICMNKPYNQKSDIWSLGVCLYELCCLKHPFDATSMESLLKKIVKIQHAPISSKHYSPALRSLVDCLLSKDPRKRPSANELCRMDVLQPYLERLLTTEEREDEFSHTLLHDYQPTAAPAPGLVLVNGPPNAGGGGGGVRKKNKHAHPQQQPEYKTPLPMPVHLPPTTQHNQQHHQQQHQQAASRNHGGIKSVHSKHAPPPTNNSKPSPHLPSPFRRFPDGQPLTEADIAAGGEGEDLPLPEPKRSKNRQGQPRQRQQVFQQNPYEQNPYHQPHQQPYSDISPPPAHGSVDPLDAVSRRKYQEYSAALSIQYQREQELERERAKERELQRQIALMKQRAPASFPGGAHHQQQGTLPVAGAGGYNPYHDPRYASPQPVSHAAAAQYRQHPSTLPPHARHPHHSHHPQQLPQHQAHLLPAAGGFSEGSKRRQHGVSVPGGSEYIPRTEGVLPTGGGYGGLEGRGERDGSHHNGYGGTNSREHAPAGVRTLRNPASAAVPYHQIGLEGGAESDADDTAARRAQEELELAEIRKAYRAEKAARRAARLEAQEKTRNHILPVGRNDVVTGGDDLDVVEGSAAARASRALNYSSHVVSPYATHDDPPPPPVSLPVRRSQPPPPPYEEIPDEEPDYDAAAGGEEYEADFVDEMERTVPAAVARALPSVPHAQARRHAPPPPSHHYQQSPPRGFHVPPPSSLRALAGGPPQGGYINSKNHGGIASKPKAIQAKASPPVLKPLVNPAKGWRN